jgi:integrase
MDERQGTPIKPGKRDNDGLHRRRGIWHYKLRIAGTWREFSAHTTNYQEARKVRQKAIQAQQEGHLPTDKAKWSFEKAAAEWVSMREGEQLAENTKRIERERLKPLREAFSGRRLDTISLDDIRAYRAVRGKTVGPRTINLETKVLRMVLKDAKCWASMSEDFKPLREDRRGPGIALTLSQERQLFETANQKPQWDAAYYAALVAVNTTLRGCELKGLRLADLSLSGPDPIVSVRRATTKTDAGRRETDLNDTALWAFAHLVERAQLLGATEPDHFLFPAFQYRRTKGEEPAGGTGYDPTRPMKTWRTAWRSLKRAAGLPTLRFHDLRHTCITKLAESGVTDHVLMSISGHMSPEMIKHYTHVRTKPKKAAVAGIQGYRPMDAETVPATSRVN